MGVTEAYGGPTGWRTRHKLMVHCSGSRWFTLEGPTGWSLMEDGGGSLFSGGSRDRLAPFLERRSQRLRLGVGPAEEPVAMEAARLHSPHCLAVSEAARVNGWQPAVQSCAGLAPGRPC